MDEMKREIFASSSGETWLNSKAWVSSSAETGPMDRGPATAQPQNFSDTTTGTAMWIRPEGQENM